MVIIGSQALNYYIPLSRKIHDIDFIMSEEELFDWNKEYGKYWVKTTNYSHIYDVEGNIVEIRNPKFLDATDRELLDNSYSFFMIPTMFGPACIPSIQLLYDIKKSTALCIDEPKHKADQRLIETCFEVKQDTPFFVSRLEETMNRSNTSKKKMYDFFHRYKIPEYIQHDRLHSLFADLVGLNMPTYARLTIDDTNISEELFNRLTHQQKVSLMAEESLVLAMERWFIPQMIENGINHRLIDMFYNNNEAMPTYHILKHVNITGLKGEAPYIVEFGRQNFFEIEQLWIQYKNQIKEAKGFPQWFFNEIFELRKRKLNNEAVGLV